MVLKGSNKQLMVGKNSAALVRLIHTMFIAQEVIPVHKDTAQISLVHSPSAKKEILKFVLHDLRELEKAFPAGTRPSIYDIASFRRNTAFVVFFRFPQLNESCFELVNA